jgi:hypothetical protein
MANSAHSNPALGDDVPNRAAQTMVDAIANLRIALERAPTQELMLAVLVARPDLTDISQRIAVASYAFSVRFPPPAQ